MQFESQIDQSVRYLASNEAYRALEADAYWPKWHSPWWHMLLLHEMRLTALIPNAIVERYITSLNRIPVKIFPIHPEDLPAGTDPFRGTPCHCQLGNVYQVLAARGVNVDGELPWIRPWFLRYQMQDGGLNCDNDAYLVKDECPSSMVGTIAAFEAVLLYTSRPWSAEELAFIENAANFLMARELRLGSSTKHNASEQVSAESWTKLCFPRFYLYDVLRGLNAISLWAEKMQRPIPLEAIQNVVSILEREFPEGAVRIGRRSYTGAKTLKQAPAAEWTRGHEATTFPLLDAVSTVGDVSPFLSHQWAETKHRLSMVDVQAKEFSFEPLLEKDLPTLHRWLHQPHVREWWGEPIDFEAVRTKYLQRTTREAVHSLIVKCSGKPIGFIQWYEAAKVGGGWWEGIAQGTVGIDQFLGEPEILGKGYGSSLIRQYSLQLLKRPGVSCVIADPHPRNIRAIRAYQKAGFEVRGPIETPDGPALLLELNRSVSSAKNWSAEDHAN